MRMVYDGFPGVGLILYKLSHTGMVKSRLSRSWSVQLVEQRILYSGGKNLRGLTFRWFRAAGGSGQPGVFQAGYTFVFRYIYALPWKLIVALCVSPPSCKQFL